MPARSRDRDRRPDSFRTALPPNLMSEPSSPAPELPRTVTEIDLDGRTVYLLGTAHVSKRSVEDVHETLHQVEPDTICVELCEPRYRNLKDPENWRKVDILEILRSGRAMLLLSSLIMSSFQRRIADRLGVQPGAEMLAGIEGAEASGAELVLADRPIEVTLKRTGAKLGFWTRTKVLAQLLTGLAAGGEEIDEAEIEKLKEEEHLADALQLMATELPQAKETLIDERDTYLAQQIREAPGQTIVAVVGAGHVEGIKRKIHEDHDLAPLMEVPPPSPWVKILKWGIPLVILGIFAYGFISGGASESRESILLWILINGGLIQAQARGRAGVGGPRPRHSNDRRGHREPGGSRRLPAGRLRARPGLSVRCPPAGIPDTGPRLISCALC